MEARSIHDYYYSTFFIHCSLRIKAIVRYIYIKNIHFHIHVQLLFYNAKLMYCNIIVMDFLGFSIFLTKNIKKSRNTMKSH